MAPPRDQQSERTVRIRARNRELLDIEDDVEDTHVNVTLVTGKHEAQPGPSIPPVAKPFVAVLRELPGWARGVAGILTVLALAAALARAVGLL